MVSPPWPRPWIQKVVLFTLVSGWSFGSSTEASDVHVEATAAKAKVLLQATSAIARTNAIPVWKLDMTFNPDYKLANFQEGAGFYQGARQPSAIGSTPGQDRQRCPVIKLPDDSTIQAEGISWRQQWGAVTGRDRVREATWTRDFLTQARDTIYINDMDGRTSLKIVTMTETSLFDTYKWQEEGRDGLQPPPPNSYEGTEPRTLGHVERSRSYSVLLDCEDSLLFVARFEGRDGADVRTELFDREGAVLSRTIDDPVIARLQFVDPNGYLLATAEAPGVHANLSRILVPKDTSKGNIMTYGMHFETGGYENASRLMDVDYRYAISATVLARAIREASPDLHGGTYFGSVLDDLGLAPDGRPSRAGFMTAVAWGSFGLFMLVTFFCLRWLFRLVYFDRRDKFATPFMRSEKIWNYGCTDMESS